MIRVWDFEADENYLLPAFNANGAQLNNIAFTYAAYEPSRRLLAAGVWDDAQ